MKRRDFLGLAAASAALAAMPTFANATMGKFSGAPLRTGHIGTGRQGSKLLRLAQGLPGFEIRAVCDVLPFRLDDARNRVGPRTKVVSDYRRVLDDQDIDAVFIATPFHFHMQPMLDALDAGKHVYCEKTLVMGHDQIERVRPILETTDQIVQTGYQHRYSDHLQHIAGIVRSGGIGAISKVECQWNRNGDWRRPVPSPEYERAVNWRMYREYSGGLVAEMSSHQMDILQWLMGSQPRHIMGTGGIDHWKDGRTTRDNTHVTVSHENGVVATYTCLTTNDYGGFRMTILGTKGTIVTSLNEAWISEEPIADETPEYVDGVSGATMALSGKPGRWVKLADFNPTRNAVAAFRESVLGNTTPAASGLKGLATSRTVQLSLDAMDNGTVETYQKDT
jgi:predicted dehydrogenase